MTYIEDSQEDLIRCVARTIFRIGYDEPFNGHDSGGPLTFYFTDGCKLIVSADACGTMEAEFHEKPKEQS